MDYAGFSSLSDRTPSVYDDLKAANLAQSAMSRSKKHAAIQHLDPRDTKPTDRLMAI